MDRGTPRIQPQAAGETKGKSRAPSEPEKSDDPGGAQQQTKAASFYQTHRTENVQHYLEAHAYMTPVGNYGHPSTVLGMGNMTSALPSYPPGSIQFDQQSIQQQQFIPVGPNPGLIYGMPQFQSFSTTTTNPSMVFDAPYHQVYMPYVQQQHQQTHPGTHISDVSGILPLMPSTPRPDPAQNLMDVYGQSYLHPNVYAAAHGNYPRPSNVSSVSPQPHNSSYSSPPRAHGVRELGDRKITIVDGSTHTRSSTAQGLSADSTSRPSKSNAPKGPPRKPKQSGHALWVGNLAPSTNIVELKDYFSREATKDLESVFLISRSNCAFVNYNTEEACLRALSRFHDTRLRGARLVCRVRRGLMSPGPHSELTGLSVSDQPSLREAEEMVKTTSTADEGREGSYSTKVSNRYFILKSSTVEDLEISRQSNIWATQAHNEESLNRAFENADNVYLFFSANKSGEYYGYARMMSTIKDDESLTLEMPPRPEHHFSNEPGSPDVIPTPASNSAPNGRIINDVARGTIFWEADTSEDEESCPPPHKSADQVPEEQQQQATAELQLIGKPFRIRWLSTKKVPFHRTRGLRNLWNANREVKIARDGTELDFSAGEKLVLLFHP
ncbi:YT521-B-like domain-containing protein [Aspergillus aurantiobrunneus]